MNYRVKFTGLLTILFIGLKLTKHIDWSWFWTLSPLIIAVLIDFLIMVFYFIMAVKEAKKVKEWEEKHPRKKSKWQQKLEEIQSKQKK